MQAGSMVKQAGPKLNISPSDSLILVKLVVMEEGTVSTLQIKSVD